MRLKHGPVLSVLPSVFLLLASPPLVAAAHHNAAAPHTGAGHVFPFLRWLRDSAVETVFGSSKPLEDKDTRAGWAAVQARYRNDVVVRFNVTNQGEEQALSEATDRLFLDVWAAVAGQYVDVRLHREDIPGLLGLLPKSLREPLTLVTDVADKVWETYPEKAGGRRATVDEVDKIDVRTVRSGTGGVDNIFFKDYQPLSVITSWLRLLEAMFPTYVRLINIGTSYEGREILGIRMGVNDGSGDRSEPRKTILITGGLHAREWISTSTVNYLIWSFTAAYGKEPLVTKLLQHFDVVFVPVVNPDGYEYTWTTDRLWRKSRQMTSMRFCRGLDLDRAFGYEWDAARHQTDPCSESYGGDEPFQAVEASQLAKWAQNETTNGATNFIGFLDLHSYSQQILYPYSYSCDVDPPNMENLEELAAGLAKAIRLSSGELYSVASACEGVVDRVYSASDSMARVESGGGSAIDWFYHEMKAHYSYQVKLRDTGSYGFLLPPENIVPTGEEMFAAMKYLSDYVLGNNGIEKLATQDKVPLDIDDLRDTADDRWVELRRRNRR
ncbi:putative metallocarboxypeptidase ecm14 [Coniochaeta pulveracea]|uniref:Inactive metallocarboxypeptidase ECM14 n=1 Tax=Coniochaeta pulveracea TaxID=177199 RepID=A0A420YDR7_9PEZI|nr:putative metallocarboxypeptidase ecm14 [Coniochaeta pulveracea]